MELFVLFRDLGTEKIKKDQKDYNDKVARK